MVRGTKGGDRLKLIDFQGMYRRKQNEAYTSKDKREEFINNLEECQPKTRDTGRRGLQESKDKGKDMGRKDSKGNRGEGPSRKKGGLVL